MPILDTTIVKRDPYFGKCAGIQGKTDFIHFSIFQDKVERYPYIKVTGSVSVFLEMVPSNSKDIAHRKNYPHKIKLFSLSI